MKRTPRTPSALHRLAVLFVVVPLAASLGACAGPASREGTAASAEETEAAELAAASAALRDVTNELVAVFERVDELGPELAEPLVETRDDPAFTQALETSLVAAGYRLATAASTATVPVAYVIREMEGSVTVTIGMGDVQARRSYSGSLQAATPAGPLYVRGTDAAELRGPQATATIEMPAGILSSRRSGWATPSRSTAE